ncbi:MAG: beta-ketoacyl-[acyl-carrier-protein] synthase family protein [Candidatus Omnitrophica bacterium]|nr:beta-ketoacyl-[acyl-carrier-protein] synthase family protein [Candidatus Omnitrophota bacterium]
MCKRIVITGIGVLASNGIGKKEFWKALQEGVSGIKPVTLFDTGNLRSKMAGEIKDFNPEAILGTKGLRNLDRSTRLALAASKLALDDAGISYPITEEETDMFGVSLGTTVGSLWSISEFDKEALRGGPRSVNPALFPNTVVNSPASQISIRFNIQGFNSTISTGFCSSPDAIYYAMNMISLYGYKVVLAGGVEDLCEQTYKGFHKIGHLAGSRPGKEEIDCPFDKRRNGIMFGEGAAIFALEELNHAKTRGARIYAELLGYGTSFDPDSANIYNPKAKGAISAIKACLAEAGLNTDDVGYVSAAADSTLDCDAMEAVAIRTIFGSLGTKVPASSAKSMIGETFSASGAMNLAASVGVFEEGIIPPTINYEKPDRRCDIDCVPKEAREASVSSILIDSFSPTGSNSVLAIGKYDKR